MAKLELGDVQLEYFEEGSGESLVMVHGSVSDYRTWQFQQDVFAKEFRTISYSRRYHWPNEPIEDGINYSMEQQLDDLEKLLQKLNAYPAHLVGHSYGAFLCLLLAIRRPEFVRSLVLAEPPVITLFVSSVPKPVELLKLLVTRPRTAVAVIKFGMKGVVPATKAFKHGNVESGMRIFGDAVFGAGGYDRFSELRCVQVKDNFGNAKAEMLGSGLMPLNARQIRGIKAPTLLVEGQQSIILFHRLLDHLQKLLPNVERTEIPNALHAMHEDNPSTYNSEVLSFLGKHQAV